MNGGVLKGFGDFKKIEKVISGGGVCLAPESTGPLQIIEQKVD